MILPPTPPTPPATPCSYIFCSILHCDRHPEVPLMSIKHCTEQFLASSGLNYTVFRLCGFMQVGAAQGGGGATRAGGPRNQRSVGGAAVFLALLPHCMLRCFSAQHPHPHRPLPTQAIIGNYAVPILEEKPVWGTTDETRTAYLDTQDVARMVMAALRSEAAVGRTLPLAGPKAWSTAEVIALCEKLADCDAEVRNVPVWLLKGTRALLRSFQWAGDASDRLAFAEVLSSNESFDADMAETYAVLGVDPASVSGLDAYLQAYFDRILKKLKEVGASSKQVRGGASSQQAPHIQLPGLARTAQAVGRTVADANPAPPPSALQTNFYV
jgi:uncharacterized protein YbjT (DUF2867 family)